MHATCKPVTPDRTESDSVLAVQISWFSGVFFAHLNIGLNMKRKIAFGKVNGK